MGRCVVGGIAFVAAAAAGAVPIPFSNEKNQIKTE